MMTLLAETSSSEAGAGMTATETADHLFQTIIGMFSRADTLAQPTELVAHLQTLGAIWAVIFLVAGMVCLLRGYQFYKPVTILLALLVGMVAGYALGLRIEAPYIVAGCLGLLLAVCALPLMKYAVALFGGLAGAFIGANLWTGLAAAFNQGAGMTLPSEAYWIGALVGLIVCGMLAFVLYNLSIVLFTSVSGATIAVLGAIALLLSFEGVRGPVADGLTASQLIVPMLVVVPAVMGLIIQETWGGAAKAEGAGGE
ncbi:hypothetical protein ACERK3_07705 [Phycisphaerales bacterium AB-hyl4]|uniref:DUF4203 domain-containing protein n=1 Tax=Natronomicrosphaera hydrolytica TaxID=3242702 RepID=A0ABV4U6Q3_9BACT